MSSCFRWKNGRSRVAQRDDVAAVLFEISSRPDADGLALDLVGGEEPIRDQLDAFISRRESDFEP